MDELFRKLLNSGLVMMPASTFAIIDRTGKTGSHINDVSPCVMRVECTLKKICSE
jgi:hypothetical protein